MAARGDTSAARRRLHPGLLLLGAALAVLGLLIFEMSHSAPRLAGSDHVGVPAFAATVQGGQTVCEPVEGLPPDTGYVQLLIGTYGHPVPALQLSFRAAGGRVVAAGGLRGAKEGGVLIPVRASAGAGSATRACLRVGGHRAVVIGGQSGPAGRELVNGVRQPGDISLLYLRAGSESWWSLLPTLSTRFGLGKTPWFGDWTLTAVTLLLVFVWVVTLRLLSREAR